MTLPSARRPAFLEEELQIERRESLKVKYDKVHFFMEDMGRWYNEGLSKKEKSRLTPKRFKRRAIWFLSKLNYEYDKLPKNWVTTLIEKHDIKWYVKKPKPEMDYDFLKGKELVITQDPLTKLPGIGKIDVGAIVQKRFNELTRDDDDDEDMEEDVVDAKGQMQKKRSESESDGKSKEAAPPKKKCKRFIDLTNKSPPPEWLEAHSRGVHLPRELTVFSTDDINVIFYDYEPKYEDNLNVTQKVHDGNSFRWWKDPKHIKFHDGDFGMNN